MSQKYASAFNISMSLFDIKFSFVSVDPVFDDKGNIIAEKKEPVSEVTLSLPIAKQFANKLNQAICQYENTVSEIVDVDTVQKNLNQKQSDEQTN